MATAARPAEDRPQTPEEQAALEAVRQTAAEEQQRQAFVDDVLRQISEAEDPQRVRDVLNARILYALQQQVAFMAMAQEMMAGGGGIGGLLKMFR